MRLNTPDNTHVHCASSSGTLNFIVDGYKYPGRCYVRSDTALTVNPPDEIEAQQSAPADGPQYRTTQLFKIRAAGEPLGPCFDTCADEKIRFWNKVIGEWVIPVGFDSLAAWKPDGNSCPPDKELVYQYIPGDGDVGGSHVFDIKRGLFKALNGKPPGPNGEPGYSATPVGGVAYTYMQWVGIKHSRCGTCDDPVPPGGAEQDDPCRWLTESFVFHLRRTGQDTIVHEYNPTWVDP